VYKCRMYVCYSLKGTAKKLTVGVLHKQENRGKSQIGNSQVPIFTLRIIAFRFYKIRLLNNP